MASETPSTTISEPIRSGCRLNRRFVLRRELGDGAMGDVYDATDSLLGRPVALKFAGGPASVLRRAQAQLLEEARILSRVESDRVVRLYEVTALEGDDTPFLVLERLQGRDLGDLLCERPLALEEAVHIVVEACLALAPVHARGVVHRDVKPGNLFLARGVDGHPMVKLLDFGVALDKTRPEEAPLSGRSTTPVGTPLYMSPEQISAPQSATNRSDIWSLGAMLFELLADRPPFEDENLHGLFGRICAAPVVEPYHRGQPLPQGLRNIILRCLRHDPAERPSDVAALASALAPFGYAVDRELAARAERIARTSAYRFAVPAGRPVAPAWLLHSLPPPVAARFADSLAAETLVVPAA